MPRFHRTIPQFGGGGEIVGGYADGEHGVVVHRFAKFHIGMKHAVGGHRHGCRGGIADGAAEGLIGSLHIERLHIFRVDGAEIRRFHRPFHIIAGIGGEHPGGGALVEVFVPHLLLRGGTLHAKCGLERAGGMGSHALGHCHRGCLLHLNRRERRALGCIANRLCHLCLQRGGCKHKRKD